MDRARIIDFMTFFLVGVLGFIMYKSGKMYLSLDQSIWGMPNVTIFFGKIFLTLSIIALVLCVVSWVWRTK